MNHFSLKRASEDFLEELRNKSGQRSQTTRRLIRKIQHESTKSRQSKYDISASMPALFERESSDEEKETEEINWGGNAKNKNKWFEYSEAKHEITPIKQSSLVSVNHKDVTSENQLTDKKSKFQHPIQTASGNINPMLEGTDETPKMKLFSTPYSGPPVKHLDYSIPSITNSFDIGGGKVSFQVQSQVIQKLNEEVERLLNMLNHVDEEWVTLKAQLHAWQSENAKNKLIGKTSLNLSNFNTI